MSRGPAQAKKGGERAAGVGGRGVLRRAGGGREEGGGEWGEREVGSGEGGRRRRRRRRRRERKRSRGHCSMSETTFHLGTVPTDLPTNLEQATIKYSFLAPGAYLNIFA